GRAHLRRIAARDLDGEYGAAPDARAHHERQPQEARRALDDREAQPEALLAFALRIGELVELEEDVAELFAGNADAAIPDLQRHPVAASRAGEHDAASRARSSRLSARRAIACIGWRRSWLAAARKRVFATLAESSLSACRVRSRSSSTFS